ncbi:DUF2062 domain-containing protein [Prochlorococcus sp. MIT 1307]|uniref:DUF2062 domain-containing protein n=1 Tax=Prochlorococcus sp. MIT 1307 TaxID=3096219 RepID=UPI002A75F5F1|nr:DUF2062 domain-containing protein [Prochlorococcus sp. MIT 1307]
MVQIRRYLSHLLRSFFRWLLQQEGSPGYKARGLGIGIFCGCFPLFGLQTILGITLASFFRGNYLFAISGTWISNPATYLPLYWLNYQVGSVLLGYEIQMSEVSQFAWREIWSQGLIVCSRLLLGSAVVGAFLGVLTGLIVYCFLKSRSY